MTRNWLDYVLTRHARDRLVERGIPSCLVRLAIERGDTFSAGGRTRHVLGIGRLDALGFGPTSRGLAVVSIEGRIVTAMWLDAQGASVPS